MKYVVQSDGSILFDAPFTFVSKNYGPDPDNPRRYIPKYDPCKFRRLELATLSCGKQTCIWRCELFDVTVSVPECRKCDVEQR